MWLLLSCGEPLTTIPPAVEGVQSLSQRATVAMPHRPPSEWVSTPRDSPPTARLATTTRTHWCVFQRCRCATIASAAARRLTMRSFAALLQPAMRLGGVRTPPTSQESAASLALVPNKCACREWPLSESAQVVEWPRPLCWGVRQCRPLKMCVMVAPAVQPMVAPWAGELSPTSRRSPAPCRMRRVVKRPGCRVHLCLRAGAAEPQA